MPNLFDAYEEIVEEREKNSNLLPMLIERLHEVKEIRPPGPSDYMSISKAPTWCPRNHVIAYRLGMNMVNEFNAQSRWYMDRGHGMHHVFQELWLGPMGLIKGGWACSECGHRHGVSESGEALVTTAVLLPEECESCGKPPGKWRRWKYLEPRVIDEELLLRGQVDGIFFHPPNKDDILDLKTITESGMKQVKRNGPRKTHVQQLHWYLGASGYRRGRLIYMNIGEKRIESTMAEFQVEFDPDLHFKEQEKFRGLRQALQEKDRPLPRCPYDRALPWGPCPCSEAELVWDRYGPGPLPPKHRSYDPHP
jgi:hypothetical protein